MRDIVYILKEDVDPYELTYSLRSVEKNFPHRKVWFVCGQPEGLIPDGRIVHRQHSTIRGERTRESMWEIIRNPDITEEFFLFNDDFFIMKPVTNDFINYSDGTLEERIEKLRKKNPWLNHYGRLLFRAQQELRSLGYPEINYDVHTPMLINKTLARESINKCSAPLMKSVYGNINRVPYIFHKDVKIRTMDFVPDDPDFLSTDDGTFRDGAVGRYIRERFKEPSRFEVRDAEE